MICDYWDSGCRSCNAGHHLEYWETILCSNGATYTSYFGCGSC